MPNHIKTVVKFKNLKKRDDVNIILQMIAHELPEGSHLFSPDNPDHNWAIDFDKIIPEPKEESECPEDCIRTKDSHIMEDEEKPWFDWYAWHCKYWGTKWGAYDCYSIIGKTYLKLVFETAWSLAEPVMKKLRLLGYDFEILYADEDWGSNCGKIEYDASKDVWSHTTGHALPNPHAFAKGLWSRY